MVDQAGKKVVEAKGVHVRVRPASQYRGKTSEGLMKIFLPGETLYVPESHAQEFSSALEIVEEAPPPKKVAEEVQTASLPSASPTPKASKADSSQ